MSDSDGFISIHFKAPSCNNALNCKKLSQLYIRVNVDENIQKTRLSSSSTAFSLQPWYSKSSTYLHIYTPGDLKPVECGDKIDLDIKLKSITSAASGKIHFQIQSRSSILYSGSYDLQTSENVASIDSSILTTDNVNVKKIEKRETSSNIILF